jgi:hypothetical protein
VLREAPLRGSLGKGHPGRRQYQTQPEAAKDEATGTSPKLLAGRANTPGLVGVGGGSGNADYAVRPFGLISLRLGGGVGYGLSPLTRLACLRTVRYREYYSVPG